MPMGLIFKIVINFNKFNDLKIRMAEREGS